jgi:hypothetical protein
MHRENIIEKLSQYFEAHELVSPQVYDIYGNDSFQFLHTDLLECLLIIRKELDRPITINNWFWGGEFTQRGLRDNLTPIFKSKFENNRLYLSGHVLGMAIDFDVKGMTANEVRNWLAESDYLFPCKIRLERKLKGKFINWVHLDVKSQDKNPKVYLFDV